MRRLFSTVLVTGATAVLLASAAAAADVEIRIPVPPIPRIVIPKPPVPRITIEVPRPANQRVAPAPRRYEYYPEARVYFDPARKLYFFMEGNRWASRPSLPPQIRVGPPVFVDLDTEQPYDYDDEVRKKYSRRHEDISRGGYQKGFDDGYEEGYRDGYNESFKQAFQDGYRTCVQERGRDRDDRPGRGRR